MAVPRRDSYRDAGQPEVEAHLRALGNRSLEILWHCLHSGVRYDEAIHKAKGTHALKQAA
jgi:hypothetical protein